ncbi:MAG: molybdopterin molybdotransferase MoeA [Campylobacteraceae bacterium]|nr:molybdopterin molybdotransferase MoeA [Campylobacteraceae bacterium]
MKKLTYLSFAEASKKSLEIAMPTSLKESVGIQDVLGRVLSTDITCVKDMPSFDNSAMDGFAVRFSDEGKGLKVKKTILAGEMSKPCLTANTCYRIMTGAQVPKDADTIVAIEHMIEVNGDYVVLPEKLKKGSNKRIKGEEQAFGNVLFKKGSKIQATDIAVLASQGITTLEVYKKITIAVVSTGNELKEPWEKADEHEIYNSNSYALISQLKQNGFDATYAGVIPDNLDETISYIAGLQNYDVIITTGGISLGDADFIAQAYEKNGLEVAFHGIKVKPGRPTMMGKMGKTYVMALPGNPLTAMVKSTLLSMPILNKMQGNTAFHHDFITAKNYETFKTKEGRVNVILGNLYQGEFRVTQANKYGSGMLTPLVQSNCIVVTNEQRADIKVGDSVKVVLFNSTLVQNQSNIFN